MSFVATKLLSFFIIPSHIALLLLIAGIAGLFSIKTEKIAKRVLLAVMTFLLLITITPLSDILLYQLEKRATPQPLPQSVKGIILLTGAEQPWLSYIYRQPHFNDAAERVFALAALGKRYPKAELVVTGKTGSIKAAPDAESKITRDVLISLAINPNRLKLEEEARNTFENAANSFALIKPSTNDTWLLITSAAHMPRALASFKKAGWQNILPYPVGYRANTPSIPATINLVTNLAKIDNLAHEIFGLIAYKIQGKI